MYRFEPYCDDDTAGIIRRAAKIQGIVIEEAAVGTIARKSGGVPQTSVALLRRVLDFAQVRSNGQITCALAESALELFRANDHASDNASTTRRRELISDETRVFVWRRDAGACVKCGSQEHLEFDHIIPVVKGGSSTARNLQLLCESCNRRKGASI
jgi:hypothetical protein